MTLLPIRGVRHLRRFQQIAQILIRHGFGELVDLLEAVPPFSFRLFRRRTITGTPQRLRMALEELGPTFVKLGQVLSTRPDLLPPSYIAELAKLQDSDRGHGFRDGGLPEPSLAHRFGSPLYRHRSTG